jgi:hypothetical protein
MRTRIAALGAILSLSIPFATATAQANPCAAGGCGIVFDWGNGGAPPDVDRYYGSPDAMEAAFVKALNDAGWRVMPGSAMTITLRLTPQNGVICDAMEGTNTNRSCHTVSRAVASFASTDSTVKAPGRVDVVPRCPDSKKSPTFAQFGQFAGETLVYQVEKDGKGRHPNIKCRG